MDLLRVVCGGCGVDVLSESQVCFYNLYQNGVHFCVRPELLTSLIEIPPGEEMAYIYEQDKRHNDKPPVEMMQVDGRSLRVVPHPNVSRRKISPHGVVCTSCLALLGSLCMNGPCHEAILGFSTNAVHIIKMSSGERVGPGKWATIATFLPQIQRRDPITFYTEPDNEVIGAFKKAPLPVNLPTMEMFAQRDPKTFLKDLTLDKPRPYQIECFVQAAMANTIVYLPTGAGKTMVAAMMTAMMYRLNPMKQVVMVVHRVSLGFQQAQYLKDQTGLDVLIACGETSEDVPKKRLVEFNVLVCTAQILINWIKRSIYRLEDASLLVLDEVHNAVKSHPYVLIMKEFYEKVGPKFRPRFLGLSASPAVGAKNHQMVFSINQLQDTCAARIYMPAIYWDDLMCTVNRPEIRFTTVQVSEECKQMEGIIMGYCNSLLPKLGRLLKIEAALIFPSHEMARGFIRVLNERAHNEHHEEACQMAIHLHQVYSAIELNSIIGPNSARQYLGDILNALDHQKAGNNWLEDEDRAALKAVLDSVKPFTGSSCKVEALVSILKGIPDGEAERGRILVFVQTKRTARWLNDILRGDEVLERRWLPALFVGQSGGQIDGMSYLEEQAPVLLRFRQGQHRLLISTNVLQEGMDVPICNRVILFDQTWSLTSFIQSRGRARAMQSVYDLICSEEDKTKYEDLIRTETAMQTNIVRTMEYEKCLSLPVTMLTLKMKLETEALTGWKSGVDPSETIGGDAAAGKGVRSQLADGRPRKIRVVSFSLFNLPADITEEQLVDGILAELPLKDHRLTRLIDELNSLADVGAAWELNAESSASHPLKLNDFYRLLVDVIKALTSRLTIPPLLAFKLVGVPPPACHEMFLSISRGLAVGNLLEPTRFYSARSIAGQVKFGVSFPQGMLRAFYMDPGDHRVFRLDIDFASIDRFLLVDPLEPGKVTLVVPVARSPFLYYAHTDERIRDVKLTNMDRLAWERAGIDEFNRDFLDLADCAAFRFELEAKGRAKDEVMAVVQRLRLSAGLEPLFCALRLVAPDDDPSAKMMSGEEIDRAIEEEHSGDFELSYSLKVLFSSCFGATSFRVDAEFFRVLRMIPASARTGRLERLVLRIQGQRFPDLALLLLLECRQQRDEDAAVVTESRPPPNTAPVRFVTLTPTKLVFQAPRDMIRNRITRSFRPEYFLRVHFRDEDLLRLSSVRSEASLKNLLLRVEGLLSSGITVGGRRFDFLAMSSSQLRDHGCWFVAPHEGGPGEGVWDADRIRAWCGDFSAIKNVAKYVARLGQSLSASQDTVQSSREAWEMLPDVCVTSPKADGQPKEYTFTDGIGMISPALARDVARSLGVAPVPSAFQIRFAGFKGVVAVNPNISGDDPVGRLWLRPSMKKFDAPHQVLEVLNTTQYIACYLNRQVIVILNGLGVPDEAFLRLQDTMLARMGRMLLDAETGSKFLAQNYHCLPALPFGRQPAFDAAATMEPFFRSLILAACQRQMAELLTRSRVFLPRARILMGTVDETGTLEPDQVFVQCSKVPTDDEGANAAFIWDEERGLFTVLGEVAIAKNPCMHPGDVRRLNAVDHPALRRTHFDCVVFPAKGPRPLPDMCSGSDLDGDLYFVTWDPALLPPSTYPPMEYDAPRAAVVDGPIGVPHIRRFLVDFIANDQLGMLANAHVAHVDHKPLGVCDPVCMNLAYLFSLSVDFPKTGFIPDFPKEAKVALWPDFMQKTGQPSYPSQKVIGRMFRKVKGIAGATPKHINLAWLIQPNPRLIVDGHQKYLEEATKLYGEYVEAMGLILGVYGIHSEAQVFAGSMAEVGSLAKDDLKAAIDVVKTKVSGLQRTFRQRFEAPFESGLVDPAEKTAKASAWYLAAYSAPRKALGMSAPVLSFPWVVGPLLVEILAKTGGIPADQVQQDYEMARSVPYVLGCDVLREANGIAGETDLLSAFMERLHFATLLIRNIRARLEETDVVAELGLAGSSPTGLFGSASDINLTFKGASHKVVFLQALVPVVMEMFPGCSLSQAKDELYHRGHHHQSSFSFSIRFVDNTNTVIEPHLVVRRACEAEPWLFALLLVLQRWARAQGFVRRSTWHSGALSSNQLSVLVIMVLSSKGIISAPMDIGTDDLLSSEGEYSRMESLLNAISITNDASTSAKIGTALMALIDFLAFSPESDVTALLKQSQVSTDDAQLLSATSSLLKEHAFKALHILAQTLSCQALWSALAISAEVQQELALSTAATKRSAKLLRRKGGSGGGAAFMEGASLLLFQGANADVDRVAFELYQLKRRPQHLHTQCYTPVLVSPTGALSDVDSKAFNDYFAQAIKQFALLKRLGTPAYGSVKMAIKFGQLYLTSLPRMFLEEGASANVANVRRALAMGYEAVGQNRQKQFDPSAGLALEPMRETGVDEDNTDKAEGDAEEKEEKKPSTVSADVILQKGNEEGDLKAMKAVVRRKAHLTPLSSSFEPFVFSEAGIRPFLRAFSFVPKEAPLSSYAVSLTLFNAVTSLNADYQLIYDSSLQFMKMSTRPLRWMVVDVKGGQAETAACPNAQDLRFLLSSRQDIDLASQSNEANDMLEQLQTGVLEFIPEADVASSPIAGRGNHLRVLPAFRSNDRIFVRASHHESYVPGPSTVAMLQAHFPAVLSGIPRGLLSRLCIRISWIAEYCEPSAETGKFASAPAEKTEVEVDFALDWELVQRDCLEGEIGVGPKDLVTALWKVGHLIQQQLNTTSVNRNENDA